MWTKPMYNMFVRIGNWIGRYKCILKYKCSRLWWSQWERKTADSKTLRKIACHGILKWIRQVLWHKPKRSTFRRHCRLAFIRHRNEFLWVPWHRIICNYMLISQPAHCYLLRYACKQATRKTWFLTANHSDFYDQRAHWPVVAHSRYSKTFL